MFKVCTALYLILSALILSNCSKACVKQPLSKRQTIGFQEKLQLIAGQKYCRMLKWEHSAILSTFIELPFVIKIFVLSIFECFFYTAFTELTEFQGIFIGTFEYQGVDVHIASILRSDDFSWSYGP